MISYASASAPGPLGGLGLLGGLGRRKALVPYVTGGITADWTDYVRAYAAAGADAIEIGLPFSDPMLDGVTIQQASDRALARGVTVESILADLSETKVGVPLVAMTYANLVFRSGPAAFCRRLAAAGVTGLIVPDLPVDEAAPVERAAAEAGVTLILLVAPVTPDDRLAEIAARSRGFVYAVSLMGTTGERSELDAAAARLADRVKAVTDLPVLIGFGVSSPEQAAAAAGRADGVVVASALMRRVLDGAGPDDLRADVAALRAALD
ncbi:tryptophan synthase subunit alpha [Paractinoplanes rhizophilus]|jgi:tryptophan synthase alpha chain|uniref:Tryptophan synthase alpha chain n=1 Tax=Paractinoplanes rhizophilus TaxID=1416877 RepID=A0ABW2HJD3_9ACTN